MNNNTESAAPAPQPAEGLSVEKIKQGVGAYLMSACFEEVTNLRVMWPVMPKQQQEELIDRMQAKIEHAVSIAVNRIAQQSFPIVPVVVEKMAIKDVAKAVVIIGNGTEGMLSVAAHIGAKGVLVFVDPKDYLGNMDVIQAQADQPDLPLEEE